MAHLHLNELSLICDMWLNKITYLLTYYCIMTNNWPLLSFLLLHWIAGKYIHSLNPILKILKFKYLQIRHKPCNQLAIKAQSFPRKSPTCSNTASLMTAPLARDFEISRFRDFEISHEIESAVQIFPTPNAWGSNSPPPAGRLIIKFPPPREKGVKCPGDAWERGGCWSFDLTDTLL